MASPSQRSLRCLNFQEKPMKRSPMMILILVLAAAIAAQAMGADDKDKPAGDKPKTETKGKISIKDIQFKPATITIKAGETVTWTNDDDRDHAVIADDGSFKSGKIGTGEK